MTFDVYPNHVYIAPNGMKIYIYVLERLASFKYWTVSGSFELP